MNFPLARERHFRVYYIKNFLLLSRVFPFLLKINQGNDYFYLVKQFLESHP